MMAAIQPFFSGAMSKTVNVPEDTTVDEIERLLIEAWQLGIKCVALYRDNCKVAQPLSTGPGAGAATGGSVAAGPDADAVTPPLSPPTWWLRPPARPANACPGHARHGPSSSAWRTARDS